MRLSELFGEFKGTREGGTRITSLAIDSRQVIPGSLFFAVKGMENDGHRFIGKAVENGASAVVYSEPAKKAENVVYIRRDDVTAEIARVSDIYNGSPSRGMTVYGVTGTNGKSTTTCIIRDILEKCDQPCGYMGTIAVRYGNVDMKPTLTTPDSVEIQDTLRRMKEAGMRAVAMEVSSHGLALKRTDSVDFDVAVFTNLTWDHLDFHKTMQAYFEAKQRLFTRLKSDAVAVLNADDESFETLMRITPCRCVSYGKSEGADYRFAVTDMSASGTRFDLTVRDTMYDVKTDLTAEYNIANLTAAIAALAETGHDLGKVVAACADIAQVDGRMEPVKNELGADIIVDYAHTPDGFSKIFEFARNVVKPGGRILAVFGSAGKRDKKKRPVLGAIAAANCDHIYLTEEDPRDERGVDIAAEIKSGIPDDKVTVIADRREAIGAAVRDLRAGDLLLILGKGDEKYIDRGNGKDPWPGDNVEAEAAAKAVPVQQLAKPSKSAKTTMPD